MFLAKISGRNTTRPRTLLRRHHDASRKLLKIIGPVFSSCSRNFLAVQVHPPCQRIATFPKHPEGKFGSKSQKEQHFFLFPLPAWHTCWLVVRLKRYARYAGLRYGRAGENELSLSLASTCSSRAIFLGVGEPVGSQMMQPATSWRGSATIDWLSFTCYHIRIHACITTRGISLSPECLALLFDCTSFQLLDCTQHPSSDIPPPTLMHSPTKAQ